MALSFSTTRRTIHESYGVLHEDRDRLHWEYMKVLDLLRAIKDGSVNPAQIEVTGDAWSLKDAKEILNQEAGGV